MAFWFLMIETNAGSGVFSKFGMFEVEVTCALARDLMMRAFMDLAASPASLVCIAVVPGVPV